MDHDVMTATPTKELTIVLASQRSGSTVLCQDVTAVGGLGVPNEYFLKIIGHNKPQNPGEQHVLEAIARGQDPKRPEAAAIKMMLNQAPAVASYIDGSAPLPPAQATQRVIDWARARFERVAIIALVRDNSLDQAISKTVANASQTWHLDSKVGKIGAGGKPAQDFDHTSESFQMDILKALPLFIGQKKIIQKIVRQNADIAHLLHYDDISAHPEETTEAIASHTRALGLSPQGLPSNRTLKKLVDSERSAQIKTCFRAFMDRHSC